MLEFFTYLQMAEIGCHVGLQLCDTFLQNKEKACKGIKLFILYLQSIEEKKHMNHHHRTHSVF